MIGTKLLRDDGAPAGGQSAVAGTASGTGGAAVSGGGGGSDSGGTETAIGGVAGANEGGSAGAGGAPPSEAWCATAPWLNNPVLFSNENGSELPAGSYVITYVSGAQIHDLDLGYEVTGHYYGINALQAGHHLFSGDSVETSTTSLWLDDVGIVKGGGTIAAVEEANHGHTWPLEHTGGELRITLYDDEYKDNSGPGSHFCISAAP